MPSTFTTSLRLTLPATGENPGSWGNLVNIGITNLVDSSIAGYAAVTMTDADYTLTTDNGLPDEARKMLLNISGTLTTARNVICPTASKLYFIKNATTGGFAITLKTSAGTGISIPNGRSMVLMCDGTNVREATDFTTTVNATTVNTTNLAYTGTLTGGTGIVNLGSGQFYKDGSGNVGIGGAATSWALEVKTANARIQCAPSVGANAAFFQAINTGGTGTYGIDNSTGSLTGTAYAGAIWHGPNAPLVFATNNTERMRIDSSGNVGIGTTSPGSALDVKGTLRLSGATSGYVGLAPAAAAGSTTYTLPTADGSAGQVLRTSGAGVLSWVTAGAGTVTGVTATAPVASTGGTAPVISMAAATASVNGYMTSTYAGRLDNAIAGNATGNFGYLNIPQNSQSTAYTLVLADSGKHILHPSADTTARIFTIPANSSVAFPIGTAVTFVNQNAAGTITIAITTDTMRLAGPGTTGSRTLAANGTATALKVTATEWLISGVNLT
jgi:hypothetical protein